MAVVQSEFNRVNASNFEAKVITRDRWGGITGITIPICGVYGGEGSNRNNKIWYTVFLDVENIRENMPHAFIEAPLNGYRHVNIWQIHKNYCEKLGKNLPKICFGEYETQWSNQERHNRTLWAAIRILEIVLNNQYLGSRADTCN